MCRCLSAIGRLSRSARSFSGSRGSSQDCCSLGVCTYAQTVLGSSFLGERVFGDQLGQPDRRDDSGVYRGRRRGAVSRGESITNRLLIETPRLIGEGRLVRNIKNWSYQLRPPTLRLSTSSTTNFMDFSSETHPHWIKTWDLLLLYDVPRNSCSRLHKRSC